LEGLPVWRLLTRADGLGANNVRDVLRDAFGDLWFATSGGLTWFDGLGRTYTRSDGLPANDIRSLALDGSGNLWAATGSGIARLIRDGTTWHVAPTGRDAPTAECFAVVSSPFGIWVGSRMGLYYWDGSTWNLIEATRNIPVRAVALDAQGTLGYVRDGPFGGTPFLGRIRFPELEPAEISLPEPSNATGVRALLSPREGVWWVGGTDGILLFDGTWQTLPLPAENDDVNALSRAPDGAIWVATPAGAYRFDGRWRGFGPAEGLPSDFVQRVYAEEGGILWAATTNGVAFSDGSWLRYSTASGLPSDEVADLAADLEGNLWMATPVGLVRYREGVAELFTGVQGIPGPRVRVVEMGPDGRVWVGASGPQGGLGIPQEGGWRTLRASDGIGESSEVYAIALDHAGRPWVGTGFLREPEFDFLGGVARWDEKGWQFWRTDATPVALVEDARGVMWAATLRRGLLRFDGSGFVPEPTPFGGEVRALLRESRGFLWAGTSDGLFRYDGHDWKEFSTANVFPGSSVRTLSEDNNGRLWVCLDEGVAMWDGEGEWVAFSSLDGLPNAGTNAIAETTDGVLWFAGRNGTGLLAHRTSRFTPQTRLTRAPQGVIGETSVLIAFEGGDAHTPRNALRYSYRLNGGPWTVPSQKSEVFLSGLPQGTTIILDVRAVNRDGVPDPTPARTVFYIDAEPPTATITSPPANAFLRGEVAITGWAFDATDFESYRVEIDGAALVESNSPIRDGILALWDTRRHPDGTATIRLVVSDRRDGEDDTVHVTTRTTTVRIDNTPPIAAFSLPEGVLSGRVEVRMRLSDAFLGGYRLEFAVNSEEWRLIGTESLDASSGHSQERLLSWDTSAVDGPVRIRLSVWDLAGNVSTATQTVTLSNPDARPLVQLFAPIADSFVRGPITFVGTVVDTSLRHYEIAIRAEGAPDWVVIASGNASVQNGVLGRWNTAQYPDGRYLVQLRAEDTDGYSTLYPNPPMTLMVDNTPPVLVEMSSPLPEGLYAGSKPLTIRARVREANRARYRLDYALSAETPDSGWTPIAEGDVMPEGSLIEVWSPPVLDGTLVLRLTVTDAAGGEMLPYLRTVRLDSGAPRVVVLEPLPDALLTGVVAVRGTVEDLHFASYEVAYRFGEGEWQALTVEEPRRPVTEGILALWNTSDKSGDAFLRVRATDSLGWTEERIVPVRVDNTAPTVSLASPQANAQVAGIVAVEGVVADANLLDYSVDWRLSEGEAPWNPIVSNVVSAGATGRLALWYVAGGPGRAILRLTARDRAGHAASVEREVVLAPFVERREASFVASVDGKVRLFLSPNALPASVTVTVNPVEVEGTGALAAYRFEPEDLLLDPRKPGTLEFDAPVGEEIGVAVWDASSASWRWLGGTREGGTLRLGISRLGVYGLVRGVAPPVEEGGLHLRCQPRAFRSNGGNTVVTFRLREASRVVVKVYHGSGRLVKRLADEEFRAGEHALVWDGSDSEGRTLPNGLYIVHLTTSFAASQTVVLLWNP